MNGHELRHLVAAGMTPLQALEESTVSARPLTLGPQAPASSELKQGYDADLIAVSEDLLDNIDVLTEPKKVTMVFKAGRLVKRED
jgi:imidazolonepropionase-like amidohydrolase